MNRALRSTVCLLRISPGVKSWLGCVRVLGCGPDPWRFELDDGCSPFGAFDLVEFVLDPGEDVGEALGFAVPAAFACFGGLLVQAVAGALEAGFRSAVRAGEFALLASVFVDAVRAVGLICPELSGQRICG